MKDSKVLGLTILAGMVMLGSFGIGEAAVSTVDSQELFRGHLPQDNQNRNTEQQAAKAVEQAVSNLPELNSRLRWAAVKSPEQLEEERKAVQRQTKAIPVIITASDIDKERKAKKRGEKSETPILAPRPIAPPTLTPAAPESKPKPATTQTQIVTSLPADVVELPPVEPVGQISATEAVKPAATETVELSPVELVEAIAEVTTVELVVNEIAESDTVELPPIQPVQ